jgi:WD40 repeat protein
LDLEHHKCYIYDVLTGKKIVSWNDVSSAIFSPDGKKVLTASGDNIIRVYNTESGQLISKYERSSCLDTQDVAFSPNGKQVIYRSSGNITVKICNVETIIKEKYKEFRGICCINAFSSEANKILILTSDNVAKIIHIETGKEILIAINKKILFATFSPDGKKLLIGSEYITEIYDTENGGKLLVCESEDDEYYMNPVNFSPDGKSFLTSSIGEIQIRNVKTGKVISVFEGLKYERFNEAIFSPDSKKILAYSPFRTVIFDVSKSNECLLIAETSFPNYVHSIVFDPDGCQFVIASGKIARILDVKTGKEITSFKEHKDKIVSTVFNPSGSKVLTASHDHTAKIWDINTGNSITLRHKESINTAYFSSDGKKIITTSFSEVHIWDAETGTEINFCLKYIFPNSSIFSYNGKKIIVSNNDTIRILDFPTLQELIDKYRKFLDGRTLTKEERKRFFLE